MFVVEQDDNKFLKNVRLAWTET